jgi:hypothetical protein
MRGWPRYAPELAQQVLDELGAGRSLARICGDDGMPSVSTVQKWVAKIQPRIYDDRADLAARHDGGESWADLLKAVDGKTPGLPHKRRDDE